MTRSVTAVEASCDALDENRKRGLMKFVELLRVDSELQSGTPVVKSIPVECQQDLALAWVGEVPHAQFDALLFESASEQQQFLHRLNPRLVNA